MYKHDIYSISASQDNEEAEDMGDSDTDLRSRIARQHRSPCRVLCL